MATVNFFDSFSYKWAQTGNVYAWDDAQYKQGWATIGAVPPSVEQFNRLAQVQDEKLQWLFNQLSTAAASRGVTLNAADATGLRQTLDNVLSSVPTATTAVAGKTAYATDAETQNGTVSNKAVTPSSLNSRMALESRTGLVQLASAAEAQALSTNSKALTPSRLKDAFSGTNANFASNGYQRLPSGLIIQWMSVSSASTAGRLVLWPLTFPTAFLSASVTEAAGGGENMSTSVWTASAGARASIVVHCHSVRNGGAVERIGNAAGLVIGVGV